MLEMDVTPDLTDADTNGLHDLLFETKDYARRIHWWVRLFGVLWLSSIILGVVGGLAAFGFMAGQTSARTTAYGSYSACMADPSTTLTECNAAFGP
jgi:hypothetical protein